MKPNLLVINPSGSEPAPWVEALCNQWMEDCYVYLLCPGCGFRDDNERGVRFLSHDGKVLPCFGHLGAVVAFARTESVRRLMEIYPDVPVRVIPSFDDALAAARKHPLAA
jgi:hypothetical protein